MAKTIVVGLDGASWNLLAPWMHEGRLPNLSKLVATGSSGDLLSTIPAVTYPAWKCYSTGKNPGKLGAYWWLHVDWRARRILPVTSESFRSRELWDHLNDAGVTTGVMNMPTCWPPRSVDGFMVSGCIADGTQAWTHPPGLARELARDHGYRLKPAKHFGRDVTERAAIEEAAHDFMDVTEKRFDAAHALQDRVDFLHLTIFYIDDLQHYLYDDPLVAQAWERIDARLAPWVEDESLNLALMSDHGFTRLSTNFFVNAWLESKGYLVTKRAGFETLHKLGANHDRANRWGRALGLHRVVPERVKRWVWRALPNERGEVRETARESKVDWARSAALANGEGPVYVNPDLPDRDAFVRRLRDEMRSDPEIAPFVADAHLAREIYDGPHVDLAPDVVLVPRLGVELSGVIGEPRLTGRDPGTWVGCHRPEGILVTRFPGARRGRIEGARIYDLAPTLLALHGAAIPEDLDGRVLQETLPPPGARAREVPTRG